MHWDEVSATWFCTKDAINQAFSVALVEAQLILANIFFNFDVELSPESRRWLDVQWAHMVSYSPFRLYPQTIRYTSARYWSLR